MIEAIVVMRNGYAFTAYASSFEELFSEAKLGAVMDDISEISGREIGLKDMRQGKENANWQLQR